MSTAPARPTRPPLARSLAANVLPAYLAPTTTAFAGAVVSGDDRLAQASFTTIAGPSALAAALVTVWLWSSWRAAPGRAPTGSHGGAVARAALVAGLGCGALALGVCVALVGGVQDQQLLVDAVPSAALGGAIAAAASTHARRRRERVAGAVTHRSPAAVR